jgi:hypothetical protein
MNHKTLAVCLMALGIFNAFGHVCHKRVRIDHKIIKVVDGTPRIDMVKILNLENGLLKMQEGDHGGLFTLEGKRYTTKQLLELEKKGRRLKGPLNDAISHFEKITRSYLHEARGFKPQMCALIKKWAEQRKVKSILVEWGNQGEGQELEQLKKLAPTFEDFDGLLSDLSCFLKDLRFSCKESWEAFLKVIKRNK